MKQICRIILAVLAIAAIAATSLLPALAEADVPNAGTGATPAAGRGGDNPQEQCPGMKDRQGQQDQRFGMKDQRGRQGQQGQRFGMNDRQGCPCAPGCGGMNRKGIRGRIDWDAMVKDGVIDEKTRDDILEYLESRRDGAAGPDEANADGEDFAEEEIPQMPGEKEIPGDGERPEENGMPEGEEIPEELPEDAEIPASGEFPEGEAIPEELPEVETLPEEPPEVEAIPEELPEVEAPAGADIG